MSIPKRLLLTGILSGLLLTSSAAALPAPTDVPAPPAAVPSPGGEELPATAGSADLEAPAIAAITEVTFPGETLVMTGVDLDGALLKVWTEGGVVDVEPLRTAPDRLQAVVPDTVPASVMLVWPKKGGKVGAPIRVNGPDAWWSWPARIAAGQDSTVRVFGKNLTLAGWAPVVCWVKPGGEARMLEVIASHPYHVEARLPAGLRPGIHRVSVHNGTGGPYGWSEALTVEVVEPVLVPDRVVHADDYVQHEAPRFDVADDIQRAIDEVVATGGGTVQFGERIYLVKKPLILPEGVPVVLRGVGMGDFDPRFYQYRRDSGTVITDRGGPGGQNALANHGDEMVDMRGRGSRIEDMTLYLVADVHPDYPWEGAVIRMGAADQTVRNVRAFAVYMGLSTVRCDAQGAANHRIEGCELYTPYEAVRIEAGNDFVRIAECLMRGHFSAGRGTGADAVVNRADHVIMERNDVAGEDRVHGKVLSRTGLNLDMVRNTYYAENRSTWTGSYPTVPGMEGNVSEQYLYHAGLHGGLVTVTGATSTALSVDPASARGRRDDWFAGLPAPGEDLHGDWIVFLSRGRGVGQWRVIEERSGPGTFGVARPWRVVPAAGDIAVLLQPHRQNIVYANVMDPAPDPAAIVDIHKTTGVYFHHESFDNVIAGNTMRNIGQGICIAAGFTSPSAWNVVRDNAMENVTGTAGGTAPYPTFLTEHVRLPPSTADYPRHFYTLGNVFRGNRGRGAAGAGTVGWFWFERDSPYHAEVGSGMAMTVVENNELRDAGRGLVLSAPANWTVVRNNAIGVLDATASIVERHGEQGIVEPLVRGNHAPPTQ